MKLSAIRVYQILLRLYPRAFREKYGNEMTRVFQDSLEQEGASFKFWVCVVWDVISSVTAERANTIIKIGGVAAFVFAAPSLIRVFNGPIDYQWISELRGLPQTAHSIVMHTQAIAPLLVLLGVYAALPKLQNGFLGFGGSLLGLVIGWQLAWRTITVNAPNPSEPFQDFSFIAMSLTVGLVWPLMLGLPSHLNSNTGLTSKWIVVIGLINLGKGMYLMLSHESMIYSPGTLNSIQIMTLVQTLGWLSLGAHMLWLHPQQKKPNTMVIS